MLRGVEINFSNNFLSISLQSALFMNVLIGFGSSCCRSQEDKIAWTQNQSLFWEGNERNAAHGGKSHSVVRKKLIQ